MRAYVISTGLRIAPFGDPGSEMPIGGLRLGVWQQRWLERFGFELVRVDDAAEIPSDAPRLVTRDHVLFTRRVLKSFLSRWKKAGRPPARVALPLDSTFVRLHSDLQSYERDGPHALYDLWLLPPGARLEDARPLPVIFAERVLELPVPRKITGVESWSHSVTTSVCLHIHHWLHVLQANLLSLQIRWVDEVVQHPLWTAGVLARALLLHRGRLHWRIAAAANRIGRGVDIHPTARVEASFIGDGVKIGPQALVRASIVGPRAILQERVNVSFAVIGADCFVSKHSIVYATAADEAAELCMKGMQMCLVGRRAALTARASPIDVSPGKKIRVRHGERFPELELPLLGSCYGHDTFVGADVLIGPGRELPNGLRVGPRPDRVLSRIPTEIDPEAFYAVEEGGLWDPRRK